MKTFALGLIVALIAGDGGKIEWSKDVKASLQEARDSGRPAMLYFTADW